MSDRPGTGPMRFGDDWTGLFIRGDWALDVATGVRAAADRARAAGPARIVETMQLEALYALLMRADHAAANGDPELQTLASYEACSVTAKRARLVQDSRSILQSADYVFLHDVGRGIFSPKGLVPSVIDQRRAARLARLGFIVINDKTCAWSYDLTAPAVVALRRHL